MGAIERVFRGRRGGQERPSAAIVAGLWRNGEQGVWYDPSDLSTMFQDATGTTPVTAPGHPVGLILDRRLGLQRGPEKVVNGGFDSGATGWAVSGSDATHVATFSGGALRYQSDTTSPALTVTSSANMALGATYEIVITLTNWVSGQLKTDSLLALGTVIGLPLVFTGPGVYRFIGKAASPNFGILRGTTNVDLTIGSISIRELPGNHAYQATTTSRMTYQVDAAGCSYVLSDGVDDSLQTASIDFSGSDKLFICAAARKLSDAAAGMLVELSANIGAYAGSFYLSVPETTDGSQCFRSRGSLLSNTTVSTKSVPAPASFVLTGIADIGGMRKAIRLNGTLKGTSSEDQGVGSFGNYPLYIGRRGGATIPFNGRLYGLLIRGGPSTDAQIKVVEKYLNAKARAY